MSVAHVHQLTLLAVQALLIGCYLAFLFRLRKTFGLILLCLSLGGFQHLQVVLSLSIYVEIYPSILVSPGSIVLFPGCLFAVLLIHLREDVLVVRRVIYAVLFVNGIVALLSLVVGLQLSMPLTHNFLKLPASLFLQDPRVMIVGTSVLFFDCLLLVFLFESLPLKRFVFLRILCVLALVLWFDTILFSVGAFWEKPLFAKVLLSGLVGKTFTAFFFSVVLAAYLRWIEPQRGFEQEQSWARSRASGPWRILGRLTFWREFEHLQESEERYTLAAQGGQGGIWDWRIERDELYFSAHWFAMAGLPLETEPKTLAWWLAQVHEDDRERLNDAITEQCNASTTGLDVEYRIICGDGETRWIQCWGRAIQDDLGRVHRLVGSQMSIEEHKQLEKLKDDFVSTVSHELRTPLTSIQGALSLVKGGVFGEVPTAMHQTISIAHRNSQRLLALINDILDVQKMESGKLDYAMAPHDLLALVSRSLEDNEPYARSFSVTIDLQSSLLQAPVQVDELRILQVMANLLSNASKFSPEEETIVVTVEEEEGGDAYRVAVRDRGAGISPEFLPRVFERFAQADGGNTRNAKGTGLGLCICQMIVAHHGGEIDVASTLGEGTTFWFTLPRYSAGQVRSKLPSSPDTPSRSGKP